MNALQSSNNRPTSQSQNHRQSQNQRQSYYQNTYCGQKESNHNDKYNDSQNQTSNRHSQYQKSQNQNTNSQHFDNVLFTRCGLKHYSYTCPAKGYKCDICGIPNHFARVCRQRNTTQKSRHINTINSESEQTQPDENAWNFSINRYINQATTWISKLFMPLVALFICHTDVSFGLDTGAYENIMDEKTYNSLKIRPKLEKHNTNLYPYGCPDQSNKIKTLGKFRTRALANGIYKTIEIVVANGNGGNLLGYDSAVELGIMPPIIHPNVRTVRNHSEQAKWVNMFPKLFEERIGLIKNQKVKLHIDTNIRPKQEKLRHIPFHLRGPVEIELSKMLDNDIIEPIDGPTPWVSPIVPVLKQNGSNEIRICTDARSANQAIQRQSHITPTIEDLVVELNGASVISKFDLKSGYNQLEIEESCRFITAFCTHLGIFQYKRLNFGINTAAELFQKAIENVLLGLHGVKNISDDIIVFGKDQIEHDKHLEAVLKRLEDSGMTLNKNKCVFSTNKLEFFGLSFSNEGISIHADKINALQGAKQPKNQGELRSFLGLASYCSRFIRDFATVVQPLRQLTKKHQRFEWLDTHQHTFDSIKTTLTTTAMAYYNKDWKTVLTVDASPVGLGVVMTQYDPNDHENIKIIQYEK